MANISMNQKIFGFPLWAIGGLLVVGLAMGWIAIPGASVSPYTAPVGGSGDGTTVVTVDQTTGTSATIDVSSFDQTSASLAEVYPTYYIFDNNGNLLVDGANANTTVTYVGQKVSFYGGDSTYYVDKKESVAVTNQRPNVGLSAYAIPSEANMAVVGYDKNGNALTADDNANATMDYSLSLGQSQEERVRVELQTAVADREYHLKGVCTFATNDVASFKVDNSDWTEVMVPEEIKTASFLIANDTLDNTTVTYDSCYVYKAGTEDVIKLGEWDDYSLNLVIKASSTTDPTANTGDLAGLLFVDGAWSKGDDGKVYFDIYRHDANGRVSESGLAETEGSPQGLDVGVVIEAQ